MNIEQMAQNDALQNKNMSDDPKWSAIERQRYAAAYNGTKQRLTENR